jgi:hypothetical protein
MEHLAPHWQGALPSMRAPRSRGAAPEEDRRGRAAGHAPRRDARVLGPDRARPCAGSEAEAAPLPRGPPRSQPSLPGGQQGPRAHISLPGASSLATALDFVPAQFSLHISPSPLPLQAPPSSPRSGSPATTTVRVARILVFIVRLRPRCNGATASAMAVTHSYCPIYMVIRASWLALERLQQ